MAWQVKVSEALLGAAALAGTEHIVKNIADYLYDSNHPPSDGDARIPTSRKALPPVSPKIDKKNRLKEIYNRHGDLLVGTAGAAITLGSGVFDGSKSERDERSSLNQQAIDVHVAAPIVQNQIIVKQSIDDLTHAINSNTAASVTLFGNLDNVLVAIASGLFTINETLLTISGNYDQQLNNTNDLPYIDTQTYYDRLSNSGMSETDIMQYRTSESELVRRLSNEGQSYSDIKEAVRAFRQQNVPIDYNFHVEAQVSGLTAPSGSSNASGNYVAPAQTIPNPSLQFPDLSPLMSWAQSAKLVADHAMTPQTIKDLDGNPIAEMAPAQAKAVSAASNARHKTDINNEDFSDMDTPMPDLDIFSMLKFFGRSDMFEKDFVPSDMFTSSPQ